MVLATDFIQTYATYNYIDSTLDLPNWQRIVIGYDVRDFDSYHNVQLDSGEDYLRADTVQGNTGLNGLWLFNLTGNEDSSNPEARCLMWVRRQQQSLDIDKNSLRISSCPCTRRQARRDWSFWFAHFWGLSLHPNCATVLFSGSQSTIECCYDDSGALIVGPSSGGSLKLYNPLFFYQDNYVEDTLSYQDCCVNSDLCNQYYRFRPSDNCSNYEPPAIREFNFTT